jgi:hypothetical protein
LEKVEQLCCCYSSSTWGGYNKHPDINSDYELLFENDGVHLSRIGNELYLVHFVQQLGSLRHFGYI